MPQHNYEIRVRGRLGGTFRTAFPGLRARTQGNDTVLSGSLADRAALYGVLAMIETLGLELVELRRVTSPELVSRMVRAGELEVSGEDQAEVDTYFDQQKFRFHGPGGFETDYAGLTAYFASLRAAFDNGRSPGESSWPKATPWHARRGSRAPSRTSSPSHQPVGFPPTEQGSS